ncbi:helix-turn-helix domain-containing protein [Mycobacteroides abscessus]|uniref:helix-turn-helix domain-containing protein n=1 Tax=Mycobacteroides abscessus TaxID=36809 RepID=UPI0013000EE5|nr:helix-turn-helix domain-containing protein [Mycobacteroides abscessus]
MSLGSFDLRAAVLCARTVVALYQPGRSAPTWLLDHLAHLERVVSGSVSGTKHVVQQEESELIGTAEAARILGYSTSYVRRIHTSLDGRRIGNGWTFPRKVVEEYARMASRRTA